MTDIYATDNVVLRHWTGESAWGVALTRTDESLKVRVTWKERVLRDSEGEERVCAGHIDFPPDTFVDRRDLVQINGVDYRIIQIQHLKDFRLRAQRVFIQ